MLAVFCLAVSLFSSRIEHDENGRPKLPDCRILYYENFSDPNVRDRWMSTSDPAYSGKWQVEQTYPLQSRRFEKAIVLKARDEAGAVATKFRHPIGLANESLVIQFEARAQLLFICTSGFMKIFTDPSFEPRSLNNATAHWIEFGPERCGRYNITRFNVFTEKNGAQVVHSVKRPHWIPVDEVAHLYTLIIRPDGSFETLIDNRSTRNGTFTGDFEPPLFEMPMIDDPSDKKPSDWVDDVLIPDPNAVKPDDWDDNAPEMIPDPKKQEPPKGWLLNEPEMIADPRAKKPDTWDADKMGDWKPPQIRNPKCHRAPGCGPYTPPKMRNPKARGRWRAPYVPNPNYKGEWKPRQIPNPNYHGETPKFVMPKLTGIGFDIWAAYRDIAFTNILIATNETVVRAWNENDFVLRQRRQIKAMKINYDWVNIDLPDDLPEPGLSGQLAYYGRCAGRYWKGVKHKSVVFAVSITGTLIVLLSIFFCWMVCEDDPFAKLKTD